jgi:hypothetical protein
MAIWQASVDGRDQGGSLRFDDRTSIRAEASIGATRGA